MLKNKLWIVALFAALAIGFIGCTNAAYDWEAPTEELDENALQILPKQTWAGIELNHPKFNFAAGDVIVVTGKSLAANSLHISYNHQGRNPIGTTGEQRCNPDDEFELKGTLTKDHVTSIAGLNPPAVRIYGNTAGATFIIYNITVTRDGTELFNFYEMILKALKPGTTGAVAIFGEKGADTGLQYRAEEWVGVADGENNSHSEAVYTILGPGFGGDTAAEADPEYAGGELTEKGINIVYDDNGTPIPDRATAAEIATATADDKVIDNDPHITGVGTTIDKETGFAKVSDNGAQYGGSVIRYKFPTNYYTDTDKSKIRWTPNALDLEADFDNIVIDYEVKNISPASLSIQFKAVQYETGWDGTAYKLEKSKFLLPNAPSNYDEYLPNITTSTGSFNVKTWPAGGKGGIELVFNAGNRQNIGTFDFKITKVTFTKETRRTVTFLTPQTPSANNIAPVTLLSGDALGSRLPAPKNPGWTFVGWYTGWNASAQNTQTAVGTTVANIGTQYTAATLITADITLYAVWFGSGPADVTDSSPSFTAQSATNTPTVNYDSKQWFLVAQSGSETEITGPPAADFTTEIGAITGKGVITYTLADAVAGTPFPVSAYKNIKITYDVKFLDDSNGGYVMRNGPGESSTPIGGYGNAFTEGNDNTLTVPLAHADGPFTTTWGFHGGYGDNHAYIIRFTKVELLVD